jgi:large subunit ribosomal protein L9
MKIILIEDVDNLGRRGSVVSVSDGYARNYLIPRKFALTATAGNMNYLANQKLTWAKQESKLKEEAEILAKAVNEVVIEILRRSAKATACTVP